jgi:hypothetical protein
MRRRCNAPDTQVGHVLASCMTSFAGDSLCRGVLEFAKGNITIDQIQARRLTRVKGVQWSFGLTCPHLPNLLAPATVFR